MKKVHIYVDESEINGNILLGAVVIPDKHRYTLERRLNDLRRRMLREMKTQNYPILDPMRAGDDRTSRQRTERIRLAAGGLPEIHAAELWTGDEVFWKERDGTRVLFDRHLKWLRETLKLVDEFQLTYHLNVQTVARQQKLQETPEVDISKIIAPWLTKDVSVKRLKQLQKDPFVRTLFGFMQALEAYAIKNGWTYGLICDRGKKNEIFQTFETFGTLKKYGSWQRLNTLDFQESHDNVLIQLSDVVTYIEAKATWLGDTHKDKSLVLQLRRRYLRNAYRSTPIPYDVPVDENGFFREPSIWYAEVMAMLTEMALLHCGGTASSLEERKNRLQQIMSLYPDVFLRGPEH